MSAGTAARIRQVIGKLETDGQGYHAVLGHADIVEDVLVGELHDWVRYVPELGQFVVRDETTLVWSCAPMAQRLAVSVVGDLIRELVDTMKLRKTARAGMLAQSYKMAVMQALSDCARITRGIDQWDENVENLQTPDGVVNLEWGTMRPTTLADFNLNCTAVSPMRGPTPVFDQMLASGFLYAPEQERYLWSCLGASMWGDNTEQAVRWLIGESGSGKSSLLFAVLNCLGSYGTVCGSTLFVATRDEALSPLQERAEMGRLAKARFALADEVNQHGRVQSRVIKQITNNDRVLVEDKFKPTRETRICTNVWITANNIPSRIAGGSEGIERRMQIVEMNGTPAVVDMGLRQRMEAERPAILARLVRAASDWFQKGPVEAPAGSRMLASVLTAETKLVPRWWAERWVFDGDVSHRVWASDLWDDFAQQWWPRQSEAKAHHAMVVPISEIEFYRQLRDRIVRIEARGNAHVWSEQMRMQVSGQRRSGYLGVARKT